MPQYGGFFNDLTLHDNLKAISEIVIENKNYRSERINYLISKFELNELKDIKAKFLSGGQSEIEATENLDQMNKIGNLPNLGNLLTIPTISI